MREGRSYNQGVPTVLARRAPLRASLLQALSPSLRLTIALALFIVALAGGTTGYLVLSEMGPLDAFYQTIITLSTVGYAEVEPFGRAEKIFTSFLIVFGVGTALYALSTMVQETVEGDLRSRLYLGRERMRIERLSDHAIVCGFGRVGQQITRELRERNTDLVVIEAREPRARLAREEGCLVVEGDATLEATLRRARLETARTLLVASDSDSGNTFITLTAKGLNPACLVVARVGLAENIAKLELAGADRIVSPYRMGARQMAVSALWPAVAGFVDTLGPGPGLVFAHLDVDRIRGAAGQSCGEFLAGTGATLLGLRHGGEVIVGPPPERRLEPGDILLLLGEERVIAALGSGA